MAEDLIELLGLDEETISRDLNVNFSLGGIYEREENPQEMPGRYRKEDRYLLAATHFRRAGSQALLLANNDRINEAFLAATRNYDILDLPYASVTVGLTIYRDQHLGHARQTLSGENGNITPYSAAFQRQHVYTLIAFATANARGMPEDLLETLRRVRQELETQRRYPIGVLGIPLGDLLDIVDALAPPFAIREVSPQNALVPLIGRYSFALIQARDNRSHWETMSMPFHPAEPDVFGIFGMIEDSLRKKFDIDLLNTFGSLPLRDLEIRVLMEIYRRLPRKGSSLFSL